MKPSLRIGHFPPWCRQATLPRDVVVSAVATHGVSAPAGARLPHRYVDFASASCAQYGFMQVVDGGQTYWRTRGTPGLRRHLRRRTHNFDCEKHFCAYYLHWAWTQTHLRIHSKMYWRANHKLSAQGSIGFGTRNRPCRTATWEFRLLPKESVHTQGRSVTSTRVRNSVLNTERIKCTVHTATNIDDSTYHEFRILRMSKLNYRNL